MDVHLWRLLLISRIHAKTKKKKKKYLACSIFCHQNHQGKQTHAFNVFRKQHEGPRLLANNLGLCIDNGFSSWCYDASLSIELHSRSFTNPARSWKFELFIFHYAKLFPSSEISTPPKVIKKAHRLFKNFLISAWLIVLWKISRLLSFTLIDFCLHFFLSKDVAKGSTFLNRGKNQNRFALSWQNLGLRQ